MGKVILGMTMSLDGFINDREGSVAALYSDLATWQETESGRVLTQNRSNWKDLKWLQCQAAGHI
jgi:hypothetical protein